MVALISHGRAVVRGLIEGSKTIRAARHLSGKMAPPEMWADEIVCQETEKAGIIIVNRAKDLNALSLSMGVSLNFQIKEFEKHKSLLIMKSATPKFFSAGGDIMMLHKLAPLKNPMSMYYLRIGYKIPCVIANLRIPFVALMNGLTMGGGAGISVPGTYRVCTETTDFSMPELRVGLINDVCSTHYMARLKNHVGFYLALTASRLRGYDNVISGIATHFCPSEKIDELERALWNCEDPKEVLDSFCKPPENHKYFLEPYEEKINDIFSSETAEEILAKLENDGSPWAKKTIAAIRSMCPLALKVSLKQLQFGKVSTIEECAQKEYILANSFFYGENFLEGVRANLIERDNKPKWVPPTIEEVTPEMIENLFKVHPHWGPLEFGLPIREKL